MDRGQAEIAWRETMNKSRSVLQLLAGEDLPTYISIPSEDWPEPRCRVAAFLREWASALDGAAAGTSVPITGTIGNTKGEHDDR